MTKREIELEVAADTYERRYKDWLRSYHELADIIDPDGTCLRHEDLLKMAQESAAKVREMKVDKR